MQLLGTKLVEPSHHDGKHITLSGLIREMAHSLLNVLSTNRSNSGWSEALPLTHSDLSV